jgi:hypothetical protein
MGGHTPFSYVKTPAKIDVTSIEERSLFDDLNGLFYENLLPAYDAFRNSLRRNDSGRNVRLRTTIDAATALFHFREHLPAEHQKSRKAVTAGCPDYRLVADVANAAKHRDIDRPTPDGPLLVSSGADIYEQIYITQFSDEDGEYTDCRVSVIASCTDGVIRNVDRAVVGVFEYWRRLLWELDVNTHPSCWLLSETEDGFVMRAKARNPNFEILNTVRWSSRMQILKYNSFDQRSYPVELSGAKIEMNIYRPAYTVGVRVEMENGAVLSGEIGLSESEAQEYHRLTDDAAREAFVRKIAISKKGEIREQLQRSVSEGQHRLINR